MNKHHVIGLLSICIAVLVWLLTRDFPGGTGDVHISGPAFFPRVLAGILGIAGLSEILVGSVASVRDGEKTISVVRIRQLVASRYAANMGLIIVLLVFFLSMFNLLGFFVTGFIVVFTLMIRLGVPWVKNLVASLIFVIVIDLLFGRLFTISLPSGVLSVIGL